MVNLNQYNTAKYMIMMLLFTISVLSRLAIDLLISIVVGVFFDFKVGLGVLAVIVGGQIVFSLYGGIKTILLFGVTKKTLKKFYLKLFAAGGLPKNISLGINSGSYLDNVRKNSKATITARNTASEIQGYLAAVRACSTSLGFLNSYAFEEAFDEYTEIIPFNDEEETDL